MKKIFILFLISIGILLVLPSVEAKTCCQIASYYYCASGDSCPIGGPADCSHCGLCSCCGLDTGCDACGPILDPCRANIVCNNYKCGVCLRGEIELDYCWHLDEAQCSPCTGCYWDGIAHSCKGTPSIMTSSDCSNCHGTWNSNDCASCSKTCCYSTTQQGLCTGGTSLNPSCAFQLTCSETCINKIHKYSCTCSGSFDAAECQCLDSKDVECCNDNDCISKSNRIGKCDSPSGTDNLETSGYTYECWWGECSIPADCDTDYCCELQVGLKTTTYGCIQKGTIKDSKYLCDPPDWASNEPQSEKNIPSIINVLWNFFANLIKS